MLKADNKYMSRFEADKARADKEKVMKDRKRKAEARARSNTDMKVRSNRDSFQVDFMVFLTRVRFGTTAACNAMVCLSFVALRCF